MSLFSEMDRSSGIGDERALQLALELSMLGFSDQLSTVNVPDSDPHGDLSPFVGSIGSPLEDVRSKKSQNMTECVPVPSSEHVAEIVGRQGKNYILSSFRRAFCNFLNGSFGCWSHAFRGSNSTPNRTQARDLI